VLIQIRKAVDANGKKIRINPKKLVISPDNMFQAEVLLKSVLRAGTANNDINPTKGMLDAEAAVLSRLTSTTAWWVKTDAPKGLHAVRCAASWRRAWKATSRRIRSATRPPSATPGLVAAAAVRHRRRVSPLARGVSRRRGLGFTGGPFSAPTFLPKPTFQEGASPCPNSTTTSIWAPPGSRRSTPTVLPRWTSVSGPMARIYYYNIVPLTKQVAGLAAVQLLAGAGNFTLTAGTGVTTTTLADGTTAYVLDVPRNLTATVATRTSPA
jgi:hypothetical protein